METVEIEEYIKHLERVGQIDPTCNSCNRDFYPKLKEGQTISNIFAPRHIASIRCKSGRHPHCTCDTCF